MTRTRLATVLMLTFVIAARTGTAVAAEKKNDKLLVGVLVDAVPQAVSPEGFVDGSDVWIRDSVEDLKKSLNGKEFTPNRTCPGTKARYVVTNPGNEDVELTVVARGTSAQAFGQRTTLEFYRGVVVADTIPNIGVTRW